MGIPVQSVPNFDELFGRFMRVFANFEKSLILAICKGSGITSKAGAKKFGLTGLKQLVAETIKVLKSKQPSANELEQFKRAADQLMLIAEVRNDLVHFGASFGARYVITTNFRVVTGAEAGNRIRLSLESMQAMIADTERIGMYFGEYVGNKKVGVESVFAPGWFEPWKYLMERINSSGGLI